MLSLATSRSRRRVPTLAITALSLAATLLASGPAHSAPLRVAARTAGAHPVPAVTGHLLAGTSSSPPTTALCQATFHINCYSPVQMRTAYHLAPLYGLGVTGAGRTIAVVDAFGSPTIRHDLHVFDQTYGIADPPSLKIIQPAGHSTFNPNDPVQIGWGQETTLDVEYAHAIAPGANILLVETPVAETEGVTGFPEIVAAENYVVDHGLADVITQSFGATETTFPTQQSLLDLRSAFINANKRGVTVLASSGDAGATNPISQDGSVLSTVPVNSWPSSDPLVTSIGGTQLHLDAAGHKTSPDVTWNDGFGASGGGVSQVFSRPAFQDGVSAIVGAHRGTPDVSMSAAVDGAAIFYYSFDPAHVGWHLVGGTSEASPLFSGIVALTAQLAHRSLGNINQDLYTLNRVRASGIVDVTSGDNSFAGVTGYPALPGYDMATGIGTVDGFAFVPQLLLASQHPALPSTP